MDLDAAAAQLYALDPADFISRRTELERQARKDGERELARQIHALRKPTMSAWVANLLVRERRESVEPFLQLGDQFRAAQQALAGSELRQLSRQRRQLVAALVQEARELALAAGHRVSDDVATEVEQTLDAGLADPDAASDLLAGHLRTALRHTGFGVPGEGDGTAQRPPAPRPSARDRRAGRDKVAAARRDAEKAAAEAAAEEAAAEQAEQGAATELRTAEERRTQAEDQVAELQADLAAATQRLADTKRDVDAATREHRRLTRAAQASRTRSQAAVHRVAEPAERWQ